MNSFWSCGLPGKCFKVGDESQAVGLVTNSMSSSNHFFIFTTAWIRLRYLVLKMFGDWCLRFCFWIFSSGGTLNFPDPTFTPYSSKLLIPYKMNDWNIHWTWSQFFCWYPKVSANLPHHIFLSIFWPFFLVWTFGHTNPPSQAFCLRCSVLPSTTRMTLMTLPQGFRCCMGWGGEDRVQTTAVF